MLELAEAAVPQFVDGSSYAPLLRGENPPWRDAFLVAAIRDERVDRPAFKAVRTQSRVYVDYSTQAREMYDLTADPYQLENLAADPGRADETASLTTCLYALKVCAGNSCRDAEGP